MAAGTTSFNTVGVLSAEETNYLRAAHLIIHVCPKAVRKLSDSRHPPAQLTADLAAQEYKLKKCKGIFKDNWPTLFPIHGKVAKSLDFDITVLMTLLRNFTMIAAPSTGWDTMPASNDHTEGADLTRVRLFRNQIFHSNEAKLPDNVFKVMWTDLKCAIDRLSCGSMKTEVEDLESVVLDQKQRELLLQSIHHENELKCHDEEIKQHGKDIRTLREEMKETKRTHRKHEDDIRQHGKEISEIKLTHGETIRKHRDKIKEYGHDIKEIKQKQGEEGEKVREIIKRHEEETEGLRQELIKAKMELSQTIPLHIRGSEKMVRQVHGKKKNRKKKKKRKSNKKRCKNNK